MKNKNLKSSKSIMRSMRMNNPAFSLRSLNGFRKFLRYVYERKYIGGRMLFG